MAIPRFLSKLAGLLDSSGKVTQSALAANVAGNGPAFSAYQSAAQTLAASTVTKILFQTEEFDTAGNYDTSASRFTPTVAGYYQVSFSFGPGTLYCGAFIYLYKNGSQFKSGGIFPSGTSVGSATGSCLVYMNGSTDYLEVYGVLVVGQLVSNAPTLTYFQAFLARSAT